jgi:hypothetical protein
MAPRTGVPRDPERSLKMRSESLMRTAVDFSRIGCKVAIHIEGLQKKIFFTTHPDFKGAWDPEDITDFPQPHQVVGAVSPPSLPVFPSVEGELGSPLCMTSPAPSTPFWGAVPYQRSRAESSGRGAVVKKKRGHPVTRPRAKSAESWFDE